MIINQKTLEIADACYEMYLLEELQDVNFMLQELTSDSNKADISENLQAIMLAQQWKNIDSQRSPLVH